MKEAVVVVVVVDSHIQRVVLATEETTVTSQVSRRPIKCQSRLWSQRGTKINRSHHGDNPLLRPTGIQIATKSYAALQVMAPTNIKTVHQTSLLHIESNLDRLGMLPPTHDQRSQQKNGKITLQPVLINSSCHKTRCLGLGRGSKLKRPLLRGQASCVEVFLSVVVLYTKTSFCAPRPAVRFSFYKTSRE